MARCTLPCCVKERPLDSREDQRNGSTQGWARGLWQHTVYVRNPSYLPEATGTQHSTSLLGHWLYL